VVVNTQTLAQWKMLLWCFFKSSLAPCQISSMTTHTGWKTIGKLQLFSAFSNSWPFFYAPSLMVSFGKFLISVIPLICIFISTWGRRVNSNIGQNKRAESKTGIRCFNIFSSRRSRRKFRWIIISKINWGPNLKLVLIFLNLLQMILMSRLKK
jgi:hypothetical protein